MSNSDDNNKAKEGEFSDESLRAIAKEIVQKRMALKIHWTVYILVNLLLFVINYFSDYSYAWHMWALAPWGVGIMIHTFSYIFFRKGTFTNTKIKGLMYHLVVVALVCYLIIFIDWFSDNSLDWYIWVVVPLIISVIVDAVAVKITVPKKGEDKTKSYTERQVDKELQKLKNK